MEEVKTISFSPNYQTEKNSVKIYGATGGTFYLVVNNKMGRELSYNASAQEVQRSFEKDFHQGNTVVRNFLLSNGSQDTSNVTTATTAAGFEWVVTYKDRRNEETLPFVLSQKLTGPKAILTAQLSKPSAKLNGTFRLNVTSMTNATEHILSEPIHHNNVSSSIMKEALVKMGYKDTISVS